MILHLMLVVVAILWFPLGCRDSTGVSSVMPALRPVLHEMPTGAIAAAANGDRKVARIAIAIPLLATGLALVAGRCRVGRPASEERAERRCLGAGGLRSRAPPLAA